MLKSPLLVFLVAFLAVCILFRVVRGLVEILVTLGRPAFIHYHQALKSFYLTNLTALR